MALTEIHKGDLNMQKLKSMVEEGFTLAIFEGHELLEAPPTAFDKETGEKI